MKILNRFSQILGTVLLFSNTASAIVFNMAPLEFTNRAGCADLSTKPARSVFLQVDSFNAGKAGFAQGILAQKTQPKENVVVLPKFTDMEKKLIDLSNDVAYGKSIYAIDCLES